MLSRLSAGVSVSLAVYYALVVFLTGDSCATNVRVDLTSANGYHWLLSSSSSSSSSASSASSSASSTDADGTPSKCSISNGKHKKYEINK